MENKSGLNQKCPFCGSSFEHGGNITFGIFEGKIAAECPSCKKLTPVDLAVNGEKGSEVKGETGSKKQCYIATACYGNCDAPEVMVFREFRDKYLLKNSAGISFVKFYYRYSPYWAEKLKRRLLINKLIKKIILDPVYRFLK
jgi:hypothetical protein